MYTILIQDLSSKEVGASLFQRLAFSFIDDMIAIGASKPLETNDLDLLIAEDSSEEILKRYRELRNPRKSLLMNLLTMVRWEFFLQQIATMIVVATAIGGPFILRLILIDLENTSKDMSPAYLLWCALLLFIVSILRSLADGQVYFLGRRIGIRVRAVIIALVYEKSLKRVAVCAPQSTTQNDSGSGKMTNLMSVDAAKILEVCCYFIYIWSTPLQTIIFVAFLVYVAGYSALAGVASNYY